MTDKIKLTGVYAIIDHVAKDIVGNACTLHKHDAAAIRFFNDVYEQQGSIVNRHPGDYALVRLANVMTDLTIEPDNQTILEGATLAATKKQQEEAQP